MARQPSSRRGTPGRLGDWRRSMGYLTRDLRNADLRTWQFREAPRLERFRNKHAGETCFILGNGPSLNQTDLSLLQGVDVIGLNKIHLIFESQPLSLAYHVAVNPLVIEQSWTDFVDLGCPSFLSYRDGTHVVPADAGFDFVFWGGDLFFQPDLRREVSGHTVTAVALQIAYFMGYSTVYLAGVDHTFAHKGGPNEQQIFEGADHNHFHPDYFRDKPWHTPDLVGSELDYHLARFHYERAGRRVLDATVGGKLQVFPKVDYFEVAEGIRARA